MSKILELAQSLETRSKLELENTNKAVEQTIKAHSERLNKLLTNAESGLENAIHQRNQHLLEDYTTKSKAMMSKYQSLVKWRWIEIYGLIFGVVLLLIVMGIVWSKASELIELNGQVAKLEHLEGLKNLKITKEGELVFASPDQKSEIYTSKGGDHVLKLN